MHGENLILVPHLVNKLPALYDTQSFIAIFTTASRIPLYP